MSVYRI